MAEKLTGALYSYQTHFLYVGPLIASARHTHHAGQVMWVPDGLVVEDERRCERHVTLHIVPPHQPHSHGAASRAAVLWVDRDDLPWDRALSANASPHLRGIAISLTHALDLARALLELVEPASAAQAHAPQHVAVRCMCSLLDSTASDRDIDMTQLVPRHRQLDGSLACLSAPWRPLASLKDEEYSGACDRAPRNRNPAPSTHQVACGEVLARQSGLSVRQLRHRFTAELGLNPSAYLRWRRIRHAVAAIEQGASLTQAAIAAGFADGAHFSRVFQAQFGMAPSQALSSVRFAGPLT